MNTATLEYIREHSQDDVRLLALRPVPNNVDLRAALTQIEGRQLAVHKLPTWAATDGLLYPPRLALEQCSSEATAAYKRQVVESLLSLFPIHTGGKIPVEVALPHTRGEGRGAFLDLTGGMGVDFAAIAPLFDRTIYVERQEQLCDLARHNFPLLGLPHAEIRCSTAEEALQSLAKTTLISHLSSPIPHPSSFIFLDPARRDASGRKVSRIEDCTPDVCAMQDQLRAVADFILIKLSPMLDLTAALHALHGVSECHVVSVNGECKELLLLMRGCKQKGMEKQTVQDELPTPDTCPIYCVDLLAFGMAAGLSFARRRSDGHNYHEECNGTNGFGYREECDGTNAHGDRQECDGTNAPSDHEECDGTNRHGVHEECPEADVPVASPAGFDCAECCEAAVPVGFPAGSTVGFPSGFTFTRAEEAAAPLLLAESLSTYLYEPNASILKAGAFKIICQRFPVHKLSPQAHLYTSQQLISDFPGRIWRIIDSTSFSKQGLRRMLSGISTADITVRGFPTSVATLRNQLHLREGGQIHLIATTLGQQRLLLKVEKASPLTPLQRARGTLGRG